MPACYYTPETHRAKAHPSFLSEAEAETLIHKRLEPYGIKFVYNMRLMRDDASFVADGYDRTLRVGFEYRSHEGMDFEGEPGQSPDGLTEEEIGVLRARQQPFREYFLIVKEGTRSQVERQIEVFIKDLYAWEVLRKPKKPGLARPSTKSGGKPGELPWENNETLKEQLKDMEAREKLDQGKVDLKKQDQDKGLQDWLELDDKKDLAEEDEDDFDF